MTWHSSCHGHVQMLMAGVESIRRSSTRALDKKFATMVKTRTLNM
jgi:hypothetical protein